jgi:prepilin peptidase CpaA
VALFTLANWPLLFICVAMVVCAVIDAWKFKVPNVLTFPLILSGWALGLLHTVGVLEGIKGGIGASLAGTALGFALFLPVYPIGGMGAGDVKMLMGFGSWIGAFFGMDDGLWNIGYAFCAAVVIGGIMAVAMIVIRGRFQRNLSNTREILADLFKSPDLAAINARAKERKSRLDLLPYGVPLCLGCVGYLFFMYG